MYVLIEKIKECRREMGEKLTSRKTTELHFDLVEESRSFIKRSREI